MQHQQDNVDLEALALDADALASGELEDLLRRLTKAAEAKGQLAQQQIEETAKLAASEAENAQLQRQIVERHDLLLERCEAMIEKLDKIFGERLAMHDLHQSQLALLVEFVRLAVPFMVSAGRPHTSDIEKLQSLLTAIGTTKAVTEVNVGTNIDAGRDVKTGDVAGGSQHGR